MAADSFDTDGDGFDDNTDNCTLIANPLQRDTDGDFYGNMCDGDFNGDFVINFTDLGVMKNNFFLAGDLDTDMNGDGATNFADLAQIKSLFFNNPGPTAADPGKPPCHCYFSNDCDNFYDGGICDWDGVTVESNCYWRDIKPDEVAGIAGCSTELELPGWEPNICDGLCVSSRDGSSIGLEDTTLVSQATMLWLDAMLQPSVQGGGPVDDTIADAALSLPFSSSRTSLSLGRYTADLLAMVSGDGFYQYFCHWEGYQDDAEPAVDIQGDTCSIRAAELTFEALTAELAEAGTGAPFIAQIEAVCPDWQTRFAPRCKVGPQALECVNEKVADLAYFLSTPRINSVSESMDRLLRGAMR